MTAAADLIRATVRNRVDNQVRGASLANHRHRRSDRSRAVLPVVTRRGATSRSAPATPSSLRRPCGGSPGWALGRRPVRGVRSEEGKSGLKALRAPSRRIRHQAYGPAGYRHDSSLSFGASKATASSSAPSPEGPIFHADEPGAAIASARPVSRRYAPVENAPGHCRRRERTIDCGSGSAHEPKGLTVSAVHWIVSDATVPAISATAEH